MSLVSKYYSGRNNNRESRPFLKTEIVKKAGRNGLKFKIVQLRELHGGYSPLGLDVNTPAGNFTAGLKEDSVLLSQLVQEFGKNERKWIGKSGTFVVVKDKYINLAAS